MYDSNYVCSVCQEKGSHIHHIDANNRNNNEENLIYLCTNHHDEAHTKHQLSQNLTPRILLDAKTNWIAKVKERRDLVATVSGQLSLVAGSQYASIASAGITWGYINHRRVSQIANPDALPTKERRVFDYCRARGIIDSSGILIKPPHVRRQNDYVGNSIYDWYEHGDDLRLHLVYSAFVDQISNAVQPKHLETAGWTKTRIAELVSPGDFVFANRAFYFKCVRETKSNQHRRAWTFARNVSIEFYVDTIDMFGTTSMTVSFSGHQTCAALLHLKSVENAKNGKLVLHCSPIALGTAFNKQW